MIRLEHVKKVYPNVTPLLDVNAEINAGDVDKLLLIAAATDHHTKGQDAKPRRQALAQRFFHAKKSSFSS